MELLHPTKETKVTFHSQIYQENHRYKQIQEIATCERRYRIHCCYALCRQVNPGVLRMKRCNNHEECALCAVQMEVGAAELRRRG